MEAKDIFVLDVIADMGELLTTEQLEELKATLYIQLKPYTVSKITTEIVPYSGGNDELLKKFFIAKQVEGCSEKTLRYYIATLKFFMRIMQLPMEKVTTENIQYYLAWYRKERGCSKANMNNIRRILSTFFHWLRDNDIIVKSPTDPIKKIKFEQKVRVPFTNEEIEKMRYAARNNLKLRALIEFLLSTACRASEVANLKRSEVNMTNGEAIVMGKGSKERTVYLNTQAIYYLKKYLDSRIDNNQYLFVSDLFPFKRLEISGIEIAIRKLGRALGIEAFPHKFRHTAATRLREKGMDITLIQKILGHKKIETTMVYVKVSQTDAKYVHSKLLG